MNSRAIDYYLLFYPDSLFNFLSEWDIRSRKIGLFLSVGLYLATAGALVLHPQQSCINMSLDALPTISVPASVHHMRPFILQIVLLQAQYTFQVIIQVLDLEDLGTELLLIGRVLFGVGVLTCSPHFDLFAVLVLRI